jgi:tetratricopeptide (TPR) repeat protein
MDVIASGEVQVLAFGLLFAGFPTVIGLFSNYFYISHVTRKVSRRRSERTDFERGVVCLNVGRPQEALRHFSMSLASAVGDAKAGSLYNLAICHLRLGNTDAAIQAAAKAVVMDPGVAAEMERDNDLVGLVADQSFRAALTEARAQPSDGVIESDFTSR